MPAVAVQESPGRQEKKSGQEITQSLQYSPSLERSRIVINGSCIEVRGRCLPSSFQFLMLT